MVEPHVDAIVIIMILSAELVVFHGVDLFKTVPKNYQHMLMSRLLLRYLQKYQHNYVDAIIVFMILFAEMTVLQAVTHQK